jgi:hypothetical protein
MHRNPRDDIALPSHPPLTTRFRTTLALGAALLAACSLAHAADYVPSVQLGYGWDDSNHVQKVEVAFQWNSGYAWGNPEGWLVGLAWEVNVARWHSTSHENPRNPWEFGVSPVVTLAWRRHTWVPFMEISVGPRLLTETRTSDDHVISTAFQFGEYVGAGLSFGKTQQFTAGYRFQHVSNGGIKEPNPGTTFHSFYVRYKF